MQPIITPACAVLHFLHERAEARCVHYADAPMRSAGLRAAYAMPLLMLRPHAAARH